MKNNDEPNISLVSVVFSPLKTNSELRNLSGLYFNQSYQFQLQSNIHQFLKTFIYEKHYIVDSKDIYHGSVSHTLRSKKVRLNRVKNIARILKQELVFTHHGILICIEVYSTETHQYFKKVRL